MRGIEAIGRRDAKMNGMDGRELSVRVALFWWFFSVNKGRLLT